MGVGRGEEWGGGEREGGDERGGIVRDKRTQRLRDLVIESNERLGSTPHCPPSRKQKSQFLVHTCTKIINIKNIILCRRENLRELITIYDRLSA
jgi:hypothetical protein